MPQVLCQAVEEGGYITQAITDLPARTHHWQARRLLESSHFPLGHIAVHIKVKSKEEIKEGLPALLITRNNILDCFSLKIICTLKTSLFFVFFNCVTIFGQIHNHGNVSVFPTVRHTKGYLVPTTSLTTFLPDFPVHLSI